MNANPEQGRSEEPQFVVTDFSGQKVVVVGGSSGMGRETAAEIVAAGGSAVVIGLEPDRVDNSVQTLAKDGAAYGIAPNLADRMEVERVRQQLADGTLTRRCWISIVRRVQCQMH